MTTAGAPVRSARRAGPSRLLEGASVLALAVLGCRAAPAEAQLARQRAAAGGAIPTAVAAPAAVPVRPTTMREALARQTLLQSRTDNLRALVASARDAALAASRTRPTDGLSAGGLDPITAVREAARLTAAGDTAGANALLVSVSAANDATGLNTWEGADAPVQTVSGSTTTVTITQTQSRAILSWNRFDVGANTTVQFNQQAGGTAQPGWTVVNRVVNAIAPSTILGSVRAYGTVYVLNQQGVIFGQGAQVNLHSLLASSLELGNFARSYDGDKSFVASSIRDRNATFLQNGLLPPPVAGLAPFLVSTTYAPGAHPLADDPATPPEGAVIVDPGASISGTDGGFLILTAPTVSNAGSLTVANGQVSLQAGRFITATSSTGAANSIDPNVRGIVLGTLQREDLVASARAGTPTDGTVVNTGLIEAPRGYISLGAGVFGSVTNAGLLRATTSVSRNGKIALTAGIVTLAGSADAGRASGIAILPDDNGETIPQGTADSPPAFKTSQVQIGARGIMFADTEGTGMVVPGRVTMGQNSFIFAPSADVVIGRAADVAGNAQIKLPSSIDILAGAIIDVAGVKDVQLAAARNSLQVTPVKRNELRDTPTYREPTTDGSFTLNGTTLFVDPRLSGVRDDGVAWIGSPLIEAGSIAGQIPVTAAELMTKGGTVSLAVAPITSITPVDRAPRITIAPGALIDLSGGWVSYAAGTVRTSRLIASDGRIVDIGEADPNDSFVDVVNGFTENQPRFGRADTYRTAALLGARFEPAYDEGRDAGALSISAPAITLDGTLYGNAFAGARQVADAKRPTRVSTLTADPRRLQRVPGELPAGGFLRLGSITGVAEVGLGSDILVYGGVRGAGAANPAETLLDSAMLSAAGLSGLTLQTTGRVTVAAAGDAGRQAADVFASRTEASLTLAPGGTLTVDAGRAISFAGAITAASGTITARTYELGGLVTGRGDPANIGSAFADDDDLRAAYTPDEFAAPGRPRNPFDITVTGRLSTAGRWVNDFSSGTAAAGGAWLDGGTIALTVAPKVLVTLTGTPFAGDLSGSIRIAAGADLNVSAGGQVAANRVFNLTARGGDVSLVNETVYASTIATSTTDGNGSPGASNRPLNGANQSVDFTPVPGIAGRTSAVVPALVPLDRVATVQFAPGTIRGFGMTAGGTFRLVAPDIAFGSTPPDGALATALPLDFLATTGFGTLDVTAYASRVVSGTGGRGLFSNGQRGLSAFLDTTRFTIRAGETLDLTQRRLLPSFLDNATANRLAGLGTGADILTVLAPAVPELAYDRRAANITLRGLTELDVEAGGAIVGAPEATIITPKLYNAGTIRLPGATLSQVAELPSGLTLLGVRDASLGGAGLAAVFGPANAAGLFNEDALNRAGVTGADGRVVTNRALLTTPGYERFIYFLGRVDTRDGIVLTAGSTTDLAGVALLDPRAPAAAGVQLRQGRLVAGGTISTASARSFRAGSAAIFSTPALGNPRYLDNGQDPLFPILPVVAGRRLVAAPGATVDLSGASATFDIADSATSFAPQAQWSSGGSVIVGAGGTLAGSSINARGGAAAAAGGTLDWTRPTLRQSDGGAAGDNVVSADLITSAGFDTFRARGSLVFDGDITLTLRKALLIDSANPTTESRVADDAIVQLRATPGTDATISAPYIRLASRVARIPFGTARPGDARVSFVAGASGIDVQGGVLADASIADLSFVTSGDLRLIGVDDRATTATGLPVRNGRLVADGNVTIDAARVYATTGTGNLQRYLEAERGGTALANDVSPYILTARGADKTLTIRATAVNGDAPISAGGYLRILADRIVQDGHVAVPLGRLELGASEAPASSISFGAGSITSVSGAGLSVPYGSTTDQTEYYFTPGVTLPITTVPVGQLSLFGGTIDIGTGATVDGRGGGDVFAYEFVSGTGGSRDVLDRVNRDVFSSNDFDPATGIGYQYPDRRQVFAILPADQRSAIALYDPIYSADYSGAFGDLYGAEAGLSVTLDAAGDLPAGRYLLLPAHYALLPGARRVVENVGSLAPAPGLGQTLRDGSIVVGGSYATAGTGLAESARRTFIVQSRDTVFSYSQIATTSGSTAVATQASTAGKARPRLPIDAARVVLAPVTALRAAGAFDLTPGSGGVGASVDLLGTSIVLTADDTFAVPDTLTLTAATLARFNAASLAVGALRTDNADATTTLQVTARTIDVRGDFSFTVPELILAVGGVGSTISIADGATLRASGSLADTRAGDYIVNSDPDASAGSPFDPTGVGSVLRLASGPERLVSRRGDFAARNSLRPSVLRIGAATLEGATLSLDTSRRVALAPTAVLRAPLIALSSDVLQFGGLSGLRDEAEASLAAAQRLTLRSPDVIRFASGSYTFNDLTLDTPGLATPVPARLRGDVQITAGDIRLSNTTRADLGSCTAAGARACGTDGYTLALSGSGLTLGKGVVHSYGFDGGLTITAARGTYVTGAGSLAVDGAPLTLATPFVIDRAAVVDPAAPAPVADDRLTPGGAYTIPALPDYRFATTAALTISAPAGGAAPAPGGIRAPGAHISFGAADAPVASLTIDGTAITATAGTIDARVRGDITLVGAASLATPGYTRTYGDALGTTTITGSGGAINLVSLAGGITAAASTVLSVDTGIGNAGGLALIASRGAIDLAAQLNPGVTGARGATFHLDTGVSAFDLDRFAVVYGARFGGDIAISTAAGDLALGAGRTLRATGVSLTADGGAVTIGGTIDTSGVSLAGLAGEAARDARVAGGDIALYGRLGVTIAAGARLDTHTEGYADSDTRVASAGDIAIGIGDEGAAITIAPGATIDVGARRTQAALAAGQTGNRLIAQLAKDPVTLANTTVYRFVEADQGGIVSLRAPVLGAAGDQVDVRLGGTITGARELQVEAFKTYDLAAIAASGNYSGVNDFGGGRLYLSLTDSVDTVGLPNPLTEDFSDGAVQSIPNFIRNFAITARDGSSLTGYRQRPGVVLTAPNDLGLFTDWNLAAATIDQAAAARDGLLRPIPELGFRADDGNPYYAVTPGSEGRLLSDYATFLYHVGGKASGETAVVTMRAGRNLLIEHSISDGFFTFRDKSDPGYIAYQLGGGDRTYNPALLIGCGVGFGNDCSVLDIADYSGATTPEASRTVSIGLNSLFRGDESSARFVNAPFTAAGNGPAALGAGIDPDTGEFAGNPLGFAELFPLLPDGGVIRSADLRLVGGAGATVSANPLRTDLTSAGDVTISGEGSYRVESTGASARYDGTLQFRYRGTSESGSPIFNLGDILSGTIDTYGISSLSPDAYTTISWGVATSGPAADARTLAQRFFAGRPSSFVTIGRIRPVVTGVRARLSDVVAFLQAFSPTYVAGITSRRPGYPVGDPLPVPAISYGQKRAYYATSVRTGTGAIAVAAAGNVALLRDSAVTYRTETGGNGRAQTVANAQVGGTAIYTAGHRLSADPLRAQIVGTGVTLAVAPEAGVIAGSQEQVDFIPSPKNLTDLAAVVATGGGAVSVTAGGDVLGRRDVYSERFLSAALGTLRGNASYVADQIGGPAQRWRVGRVGADTEIAIAPRYFTSGVGALAGGDVSIRAGGAIGDLTVALDTSVTTTDSGAGRVMMTFGAGDLSMRAAGSLGAGQVDVAHGSASLAAGGGVVPFGDEPGASGLPVGPQYLRVRVEDARVALTAQQTIEIAGVSAIGATLGDVSLPGLTNVDINFSNAAGFFSATAGFSAIANQSLTVMGNRRDQQLLFEVIGPSGAGAVLPPSLTLASINGEVRADRPSTALVSPMMLYPSSVGQFNLLSAGNIDGFTVAMSDSDPTLLPGAFTAVSGLSLQNGEVRAQVGLSFGLPLANPVTSDPRLRLFHNEQTTHVGDADPFRIFAGVDILDSSFFMAKAGQVGAGRDIVNIFFTGQNVAASDVTRVRAGRDITATIGASDKNRPVIIGNDLVLGGPGDLIVEAGRNAGPFINSAIVDGVSVLDRKPVNGVSFGGGIRTVGNDLNPWLAPVGANLSLSYGVAAGADYTAVRERYVNPANVGALDGDLFVQAPDQFGNVQPDRTRPIYASALVGWLLDKAPDALASAFGGRISLTGADVLPLFASLDPALQQRFLRDLPYLPKGGIVSAPVAISRSTPAAPVLTTDPAAVAAAPTADQTTISGATLIGWLAQNAGDVLRTRYGVTTTDITAAYAAFTGLDPLRQRDFLVNNVYFNELKQTALPAGASYQQYGRGYQAIATLFPARLGYTDNLAARAAGTPATRVRTGNVDLRLATIETARGGDITILGPGGDFIAGSVVRTSEQAARRDTRFGFNPDGLPAFNGTAKEIVGIPIGFEGVITLRGGALRSATDGDFRVNQSRVFTLAGGDITMWSSNGDLAAGQGPKSASNFPPVTLRFDPNGVSEVDTAGSIAGAGIGAFKRTPTDLPSDVVLIAPVGEVDAGDAGVRASGNVFVAAARVANADNFSAGGEVSGVPSGAAVQAPVAPADAASAISAQIARVANANAGQGDRRSVISVDVVGYAGQDPCNDPNSTDPACRRPQ